MTERDELWVPETWEKEDEGKMCGRLEEGLGEVVDMSGGCTCAFFLFLSTSLWSSPICASSSALPSEIEIGEREADDQISVSHLTKQLPND